MFEKAQNVAKYFKENMLDNFFSKLSKIAQAVCTGRQEVGRTYLRSWHEK